MKGHIILHLSMLLFLFTSCQKEISVIGVSLNASQLELAEGGTFTLDASVQPEDASNPAVTWESSAPDIARVENGRVTALKKGEAVITVRTVDGGKTASCSVQVIKLIQSVSLNASRLELAEGETFTLEASVQPEDASNPAVTWESSAPDIAKVENGRVTALKKGEAVVTVRTVDGGKTASCNITVKANNSFDDPVKDEDWDW